MIFSDRTLKEMARLKPKTQVQFAAVAGVGAARLERYGEIFLNAINARKTE